MSGARHKPSKKEIEQWHLDRFKEACSSFPAGEVRPNERPDFRVVSPSRSVGIELTQVFQPSPDGQQPLQEVERLREIVTEKAERLYAETGGPFLDVSVCFAAHAVLHKATLDDLAARLFRLITRRIPDLNSYSRESYDWINREWFPEEFTFVRAARFDVLRGNSWRPVGGGFVPDVTPDLIQAVIDRKATDLDHYRTACDEVWLLIVAEGFSISTTMTVTPVARAHRYRSSFDNVFYFESFSKSVTQLNVDEAALHTTDRALPSRQIAPRPDDTR